LKEWRRGSEERRKKVDYCSRCLAAAAAVVVVVVVVAHSSSLTTKSEKRTLLFSTSNPRVPLSFFCTRALIRASCGRSTAKREQMCVARGEKTKEEEERAKSQKRAKSKNDGNKTESRYS